MLHFHWIKPHIKNTSIIHDIFPFFSPNFYLRIFDGAWHAVYDRVTAHQPFRFPPGRVPLMVALQWSPRAFSRQCATSCGVPNRTSASFRSLSCTVSIFYRDSKASWHVESVWCTNCHFLFRSRKVYPPSRLFISLSTFLHFVCRLDLCSEWWTVSSGKTLSSFVRSRVHVVDSLCAHLPSLFDRHVFSSHLSASVSFSLLFTLHLVHAPHLVSLKNNPRFHHAPDSTLF